MHDGFKSEPCSVGSDHSHIIKEGSKREIIYTMDCLHISITGMNLSQHNKQLYV